MKTDAQRIARYNARMLSSLIDPTLSAVNSMAVANFAAYATDFYPKQVQLRTILDGLGVVAIRYAMYEAYHGELYHLSKVASGSSAVAQATVLVTKYTTLGADVPTLKQIALDIYAITVP